MDCPIRTILVPQGAEYRAVQKGCKRAQAPVSVIPVPMGAVTGTELARRLKKYQLLADAGYLLVGLGGGLSPDLTVGDTVLCNMTQELGQSQLVGFDQGLTAWIYQQLTGVKRGTAIGCDRIITQAAEKQWLYQQYRCSVVDMESPSILNALQAEGKRLAMLRVISDDCHHDLPDISGAINQDGSLSPWILATRLIHNPVGAGRLISGALKGLAVLEELVFQLLQSRQSS